MKLIPMTMLSLTLAFTGSVATGQTPISPQKEQIGIDEHLDTFVPLDIKLFDENSDTVTLAELIDKPTIINLVYFRCPGICSPIMQGLGEGMDKADLELGKDYQALTISFDPTETIDLAIKKKNNMLNMMDNSDAARKYWKYFVSDSADIARLTDAVGFRYKKTGTNYVHAASIMVLSPEGKITRYLNGTYFLPFDIKMAVIEASKGKSSPTVNRILQFCYSYDPTGQKYVMNITKVSGTLIIFIGLCIFIYLVVKGRVTGKKTKTEVQSNG